MLSRVASRVLGAAGVTQASSHVQAEYAPPFHGKRRRDTSPESVARDRTNPFWNHTTGRWLWNDEINRARRYTPFDIDGLKDLACQVCSAGRCTSMVQLGNGSKTKVFHLQFDNGKELVARIPTLLLGNLRLSIASEAATTEYVRFRYNEGREESWATPQIPRVLSWNPTCRNPVKWPYILTEYIPGGDLQSIWNSPACKTMKHTIGNLVKVEDTLLQDTFSHYGSLYFTEDVDKFDRDRPLYAEPPEDPLRIALSHKFRIGEIAHRDWWRGGYCDVPGDRGPWPDLQSVLMGTAEMQLRALRWKKDYNPLFNKSTPDDFDFLSAPLKTTDIIASDLVPQNETFLRPVLQHPNLSRGNIIVPHDSASISGPDIKGIVDWQGAVIAPFFVQAAEAPAFTTDGPNRMTGDWADPLCFEEEDIRSNPQEEHERLRMNLMVSRRDTYYTLNVWAKAEARREALLCSPGLPEIAKLYRSLPRAIADGPASLRCVLFSIKQKWDSFNPSKPCPINMPDEDQEMSEAEAKIMEGRRSQMQDVLVGIGCSSDGWVENERYDEAKKLWEGFQKYWDRGKTAEELGPFPFHDGAYSPLL
ncbi:hypothetical protein CVT26_008826 [Gymnopilus dilepis]|uniref:Altered inheritance of mitochondria protein 9, mitochondrial n=1 Tax=Gymnopilus dilepis TaxID=231916 RepID=A0A409WP61_9AGAR|nr:hypothetical protein CVT26_008826 [Gymnopilus dilepis]